MLKSGLPDAYRCLLAPPPAWRASSSLFGSGLCGPSFFSFCVFHICWWTNFSSVLPSSTSTSTRSCLAPSFAGSASAASGLVSLPWSCGSEGCSHQSGNSRNTCCCGRKQLLSSALHLFPDVSSDPSGRQDSFSSLLLSPETCSRVASSCRPAVFYCSCDCLRTQPRTPRLPARFLWKRCFQGVPQGSFRSHCCSAR